MNKFFSTDLPLSFYIYLASHKSNQFANLNTSYSFTNWLTLNESIDFREFECGLSEIYYSDSFQISEPPPSPIAVSTSTPAPSTWLGSFLGASQKPTIELEKKSGGIAAILPVQNLSFREFLLILINKIDTDMPMIKLQYYQNHHDLTANTVLTVEDPVGEDFVFELQPDLASILGFKETVFKAGTYRSPDIQSSAAFDKLSPSSILRTWYYKWTKHSLPITREDNEDNDLSSWLQTCGEVFENAGYDVSLVLSPTENSLHIEFDTEEIKFILPEFINQAIGLRPGYIISKSMKIDLPSHKVTDRQTQLVKDLDLVFATTDLVEVSQLGEQLFPILRIFPRKEGLKTKHHLIFDPVSYQSITRALPSSVSFNLYNQNWENLPDSQSPTLAVLHFKRVH